LAACAAGRIDFVPELAGLPALDRDFEAQRVFGLDVSGFTGYLAVAVDRAASYKDIEVAWLDFLHRFPVKLESNELGWPSLLWAARAVYSTLGGLDEREVASELHRLLSTARRKA
jgi:hypothetical protein